MFIMCHIQNVTMLRWHECETLNFIGGILFFKKFFLLGSTAQMLKACGTPDPTAYSKMLSEKKCLKKM